MQQHVFMFAKILLTFLVVSSKAQQTYNHGTTSYRNQTWMSVLDYGIPIRQMSLLGTHVSLGFLWCLSNGGFQQTQSNSLPIQMESGIRALDIRVRHINNRFQLYDRNCNLQKNFDYVLTTVRTFLTNYPSETMLLHLVQQKSDSGCSRTFEDTYKYYRDAYPGLFWAPTTQDPQLGQVRGKILLFQEFNGAEIHGLLYATFSVLPTKSFGTNWDLYDKWMQVKNFMAGTNTAKKSKISFWTGYGGSYPYFVVSGRASANGGQLWTGWTTPGWRNCCRDFPRVGCFWGICRINFQGINNLAYDYIVGQNFAYTGIVYTDFYGDDLLKRIIGRNSVTYPKCSTIKTSEGCTLCAMGTGECTKCNTNMNYVFDSVNKICLAKVGYYLDAIYIPQLCYTAIPGCVQCISASSCTKCDEINHYILINQTCQAAPGYYLDVNFTAVACPQTGCSQCSDQINCIICAQEINYIMDVITGYTCQCDQPNHFIEAPSVQICICMVTYFLSPNNTCEEMPKCPDQTGGCLNCSATDECLICDTANNFIFDPLTSTYCICDVKYFFTGTQCALCNTLDAACDQCASVDICLSCVDNFTLVGGVCQCSFLYYSVDNDTCNSCSVGCLVCSDIGACTVCNTPLNFTLVAGQCECIVGRFQQGGICLVCGAMAGCIDCNNDGCIQCQPLFGFHLNGTICECDYGFFINSMNVCEQCLMDGCLGCTDQDTCIQCTTTEFFLNDTGFCDDICGDGIKIYVECDDSNNIDGDGCSSSCKVQKDYNCTGGSRLSRDICSYSGPFYMTVLQTIKAEKDNKVFINIKIQPNIRSLKNIDFSQAINPIFDYESKSVTFDELTGIIYLQFTYNKSLNSLTSKDLQVTFDPPTSQPDFYFMKAASFSLPEVSSNNLALKYYDQSIYELLQIMKTLTNVTAFLYAGAFLICLIFVSKIIAIELILVPQVAFAGLIMIEKIESLLKPFNNLKIVNGYNPLFTDDIELPPRMSILSYGGQFLTNFNICLIVIALPVIIGLLLLILGKAKKSKKLLKYAYKALKQWTLLILLAFQFQFTVSLGVDVLFGQTMMGKALGGVLIIGVVCLLILSYKKPLNFGEFKSKFVQKPSCLNHYIPVALMRIILALDLSIMSSNNACGFVALGIIGLYTLFLIIQRPYLKNVRPIMNMCVIIAILAVESTYKLNFYSAQASFFTSYLPLFMIILLLILLLANVIFMILQVKQRYKSQHVQKYQKNDDESMNNELRKQLDRQMQVINQIQLALNANNMSKIRQRQTKQNQPESQRVKGITELKNVQKEIHQKAMLFESGSPLNQSARLIFQEI